MATPLGRARLAVGRTPSVLVSVRNSINPQGIVARRKSRRRRAGGRKGGGWRGLRAHL